MRCSNFPTIRLIVHVIFLAWICAACGGGDDTNLEEGVVRLLYWPAQNEQERRWARELVTEWNIANPGIQVTVQPLPAGQSSEEVLLAAVVAGRTPDVCSNIWPGIVHQLVRAGGLLSLDRFPDFDSLLTDRVPEHLRGDFLSPDGRTYQLPWKTNPTMMLYNRGMLQEVGIMRPPATYDDYLDAAAKISADRDGDGEPDRWMGYRDIRPIWWQRYFDFFAFYIGASGGKTFFEHGEVALDTTAAARVFEFYHHLYENRYFPRTTYQGSAFVARRIATEFTGPYNIAWMEENAPPDLDFDYAPLPAPEHHDGPLYTYGDFKNIAIFSRTRHPHEAWAFTRFLVTKEADLRLLELTRQIPVRGSLLDDSTFAEFFSRNPRVVPFARQAPYTRGVDPVPAFQEILDAVAQEYEAAAVYGARSPARAAESALERIRLIHEWSR